MHIKKPVNILNVVISSAQNRYELVKLEKKKYKCIVTGIRSIMFCIEKQKGWVGSITQVFLCDYQKIEFTCVISA